MIEKEERRRFNCHRYKILTDITYGYDKNGNLVYADCSIMERKHCQGYESPDRKCPYRYPHLLKED